MARLNDDIRMAWESLQGSTTGQEQGWRSIPVATPGTCVLRAGLNLPDRHEALLAGFTGTRVPAVERMPESQGFVVELARPPGDGLTWVALTRRPQGDTQFFAAMCVDIIRTLTDQVDVSGHHLLHVFFQRIRAWQEFMRRGDGFLGLEAETGLVGELTVLREIITSGVPAAVAIGSWTGPFDSPQDFSLGAGAIEVKTTLARQGFPARIGSLEQLDDAVRQPLFVAAVRLGLSDSGERLSDLVGVVRKLAGDDAEARRLLEDRLLAVGYLDIHADRYLRRLTSVGIYVIEVGGDFPRLIRGNVPPGVVSAAYGIDIDSASGSRLGIHDVLKTLGNIAA